MTASQSFTVAEPKRKPFLFVLQSGLITSAIALAIVYFLNKHASDVNIMGWYANYVIPAGAILVGLIAGSGYGIASWWSGVKIGRGLLVAVLALQAIAYVAAEYIEYRDVVQMLDKQLSDANISDAEAAELGLVKPGFIEYYQMKAESFAWKPKNGKGEGEPLGKWGYLFVGLGALGFIAGGAIAPAILMAKPYCDDCQLYMKTKQMGVLPGSVPARKVKKSDTQGMAAYEAEQAKAIEDGADHVKRLTEFAAAGDAAAFRTFAAMTDNQKATGKLPRRIAVNVIRCTGCDKGQLVYSIITGTGDKTNTENLPPIALTPEFTRAVTSA